MEGLVCLSGENPELSVGELKGALKALDGKIRIEERIDPVVLLSGPPPRGLAERMGYCYFAGTVAVKAPADIDPILEGVSALLRNHPVEGSISFRVKSRNPSPDLSSGRIFKRIEEMIGGGRWRMRHRDPDSRFFVTVNDQAFIGWIDGETDRSGMLKRRGSHMPFQRPVVMDPRLARAMVNLSGLSPGSTFLDPFMGPGGLIIEGGELGLKGIGIERDPAIFRGALQNIRETGHASGINAILGDSRKIGCDPDLPDLSGIDGIITDPPFGRSAGTMGVDPDRLLHDVLGATRKYLKKGSPLVLDAGDPEKIRNISGFRLESQYSVRVHKSLTRYVALLLKR
ncbi:MAG: hypothetical protein ACMUIG_06720 [Thermoplasmatota archaeon]